MVISIFIRQSRNMYMCVMCIDIAYFNDFFLLDFGTVQWQCDIFSFSFVLQYVINLTRG